ncbi:MAG: hypothetical protein OJF49_000981 [Ktedonobacterales bacterium]|jgi:hypothetical protein|nr:MAG: hypothetical protein OJF49_000981 [Ktedonobacterales bacterium]
MLTFFRKRPFRAILLGALTILSLCAAIPATALAAPSVGGCAGNVKCIIGVGDALIAARQASLTALNARVTAALTAKRISSDQANALEADVSTNQTGLTNLKAKLDGDTDATTARTDVKNIFLQFRIYAVVLPRDYRTLFLDRMINLHDKLVGMEGKIADAISKAPADQQTQLNAWFTDYKNQLGDAESQIDAAQGELPQLTPENFNNNQSAYLTALGNLKNDEKQAFTDLKNAGADLKNIVGMLKSDTSASGGAQVTATPAA